MGDVKVSLINVVKEFPLKRGESTAVRAVDDVTMEIFDGEFFAMLGPSGCGKTTTLRLIAGFEQPTSGQILIDGQPMQGVPSFYRPVNTVFQDYALFPHMTVLQNVMFGLQMDRVPRDEAIRRASEALELVRLPQAHHRKPRELSGGQQQRVALARALVKKPSVLLLDEPLGALDLKLRREMQLELKAMQQTLGITFVFVTHDQEEAMTMADRIAVMDSGKVLQLGTAEEVYDAPVSRFVADFIGETNFITGKLINREDDWGIVEVDGEITLDAMIHPDDAGSIGQEVTIAVRPEKIGLRPVASSGFVSEGIDYKAVNAAQADVLQKTEVNIERGTIQQAYYIGTDTRYVIRLTQSASIHVRVQNDGIFNHTDLKVGDEVEVFWDAIYARILSH